MSMSIFYLEYHEKEKSPSGCRDFFKGERDQGLCAETTAASSGISRTVPGGIQDFLGATFEGGPCGQGRAKGMHTSSCSKPAAAGAPATQYECSGLSRKR